MVFERLALHQRFRHTQTGKGNLQALGVTQFSHSLQYRGCRFRALVDYFFEYAHGLAIARFADRIDGIVAHLPVFMQRVRPQLLDVATTARLGCQALGLLTNKFIFVTGQAVGSGKQSVVA